MLLLSNGCYDQKAEKKARYACTWILTPPRFSRSTVGRGPATGTAQRLPFHDSFRPAAPEAFRRALRAHAAARRARSAAGDGAARPGPITQLISAEKISSMSRVYFDMSVAESNTRKTHLSGSFFFWPVGLEGARVQGLW